MAGYVPKLVDTGFQHWIKANLALNITKDGIKDAVCYTTNTFHQDALYGFLTQGQIENNDFCTQCTLQEILGCPTKGTCVMKSGVCLFHQSAHHRPCPKRICDHLKDTITKWHKFKSPSWKNTRSERWCENPWELAKCYFPPDGYIAVNTFEETDINGILSLLLNHTAFKRIVDQQTCEKTREIGILLSHSPSLCIDENDMNSYLDTLVNFLSSSSLFQAYSQATESVQKITQLKADFLTISTDDVTKVLQDVMRENTRDSLCDINKTDINKTAQRGSEIKTDLGNLKAVTSTNLTDILTAKTHAISEINRIKDACISEKKKLLDIGKTAKNLMAEQSKAFSENKGITDEEYHLLKNDEVMLDTQDDLDMKWAQFRISGEGFEKIQDMCSTICTYIKHKSDNIQHVWPAYELTDCDRIMFVIVSKDKMDITPLGLKYATVVRPLGTYSEEAYAIIRAETEGKEKYNLTFEDAEKIKNAINNHAEDLMQKHQYLSVISGSGARSTGFDKGKHKFVHEACIVMYVRTKGKIPLNESRLPETLDGIKVDIREGEFQNCGLAENYQTSLRMGCQIECEKKGTLGCFLHHPEYGLCAITCAHVVLSDEELHEWRRDSKKLWQNGGKHVYQPDDSDRFLHPFGQVVETVYRSGDNNTPGVDLAIIQIERRPPEAGHFPDNVEYADMSFESGQYCMSVSENNNYVTKFGKTTYKTDGYVQFSNAVVKAINQDYKYNGREYSYKLRNQLEVRPSVAGSANKPNYFADKGDSGSPVFKKDAYGDFICIGMVVGILAPIGHGLVIPVSSIKSELNVSEFTDFRSRRIENRLANIETSQQQIVGLLEKILRR